MNYIPRSAWRLLLLPITTTAADKMHYFHLVIGLQDSILPLGATNDVVIEFDCYLFRLEIQLRNQLRKYDVILNFTRLAIDVNDQTGTSLGGMNQPAHFDCFALNHGPHQYRSAARSKIWQCCGDRCNSAPLGFHRVYLRTKSSAQDFHR